jgi:Na+-driven multidrug efflux pump
VGKRVIIALMDGVVARIGLSLLLSRVIQGPAAYWWASALAGFVSVVWGWLYVFSGRWKHRKLLAEQKSIEA